MQVTITINGQEVSRDDRAAHAARALHPRHAGLDGHALGLRHVQLRRLRRADGRQADQVVHDARGDVRRPRDPDRRIARARRPARPDPDGLPREARAALRLLHAGDADDDPRAARPRIRTRPRQRSGPRSRGRSAAAPATRTSSARCAGRPSTRPRSRRRRNRPMATMETCRATERPIGFGRLKRKEDARFIRGKGTYLDDIRLPGMVHGVMLRSPYAHAQDRLDRHLRARSPTRASRRSSPPRTSRRSGSRGCRRSPTTPRPCSPATRSASRGRRWRS